MPCQPLSKAACAKWQGSTISVPADDIGPCSPKSLYAQIREGRQTARPALAAGAEQMAWHLCFKCFSFLRKKGMACHLPRWWLPLLSTQRPPQTHCGNLGPSPGPVPSSLAALLCTSAGFHPLQRQCSSAPSWRLDLPVRWEHLTK